MKGPEVYGVLKKIGAEHLHHANSVITSCTFLEQGGLLSRKFVEDHGLTQTAQPSSDEIDKKFGIWDRIFVDHIDIHARVRRMVGLNYYGPVLFQLDLDVLLGLPANTEVCVTKKNPTNWQKDEPDSERWFQSAEELAKNIRLGDFGKMLVIRTPSEKLDFPKGQAQIILDDPQRDLSSAEKAYTHAENRLKAAAAIGGVKLSIHRRACPNDCVCVQKYAKYNAKKIDFYFE
jgi:hypothetical protein